MNKLILGITCVLLTFNGLAQQKPSPCERVSYLPLNNITNIDMLLDNKSEVKQPAKTHNKKRSTVWWSTAAI